MQEDIKKMTNENANSTPPNTEDLPLFVPVSYFSFCNIRLKLNLKLITMYVFYFSQSKAFKRKTSQLKGQSFEEGEPQAKSKKADKTPKAQKKGQNRNEDNHQNKTPNKSGSSKFEPFDYKQANYSRFQSGDQKKKTQEVQSNFETVGVFVLF